MAAFAEGKLPAWSEMTPARYAHAGRVAKLLGDWAHALGKSESDVVRWMAAGWLHDALRDADPEELRDEVQPPFDGLPAGALHGPVTAQRLEAADFSDDEVLTAVRFHTIGREGLGPLAKALITADFLEPGRTDAPRWRAGLRARMPSDFDDVAREVAAAKIRRSLDRGSPLEQSFVAYFNELLGSDDGETR